MYLSKACVAHFVKLFTRQFQGFTRQICIFIRQFHDFTRQNRKFTRKLSCLLDNIFSI